jgi:hypothetical protein
MTEEVKRKGVLFWVLVVLGSAIALFIGSAFVAGKLEQRQERAMEQKAASLTDILVLQKMIRTGMQAKGARIGLPCWYLAAIGFRLAEARDLKISREDAIALSNDRYLVGELAKIGSDPKMVITGLSHRVYGSPLPPRETFDSQLEACAGNR